MSALFSRSDLARHQPAARRVLAVLFLAVTFGGSAVFGSGGVAAWRAGLVVLLGVVAGLLIQCICVYYQYIHAQDWRSPWYVVPLLVSFCMSFFGYLPLVGPPLVFAFTDLLGLELAAVLVCLGLAVFLLAADVLPERILTE